MDGKFLRMTQRDAMSDTGAISVHAWRNSPQFQRDSKRYMLRAVKYTSLRFLSKDQLESLLKDIEDRSGTQREKPEDWEDAQMIRHKLNSIATVAKLEIALRAAGPESKEFTPGRFNPTATQRLKSQLFQQNPSSQA